MCIVSRNYLFKEIPRFLTKEKVGPQTGDLAISSS